MIINPISFTNSNNNYVKYNQDRYRSKSIQQRNGLSDYKTGQAILAKNCVVFKQKLHPLSYTYNIDATDENIRPNFSIEITSVNKFPVKPGLPAIFLFALNDQISEEQQIKKIPYLKSEQTLYKRSANIESNISDIERNLNIINILINSNIDKKHINSAKKIASTGLFVNRKTGEFSEEYQDIPKNLSEDEYEKIINKISMSDINKFNEDFINNSNVKINIKLNKKDYERMKDNIKFYLEKEVFNEYT
jgi:hypothetical protein